MVKWLKHLWAENPIYGFIATSFIVACIWFLATLILGIGLFGAAAATSNPSSPSTSSAP